ELLIIFLYLTVFFIKEISHFSDSLPFSFTLCIFNKCILLQFSKVVDFISHIFIVILGFCLDKKLLLYFFQFSINIIGRIIIFFIKYISYFFLHLLELG